MHDPSFGLVILDELNIALRYDYLDLMPSSPRSLAAVRACTSLSPAATPSRSLLAAADLVTEMTLVKHHFAAGVKAQPGIEF